MNMNKATLLARAKRELMPDVIYVIIDEDGEPTGLRGETLDGFGMKWWESREEALANYPELDDMPSVEFTSEAFEAMRMGLQACIWCDSWTEPDEMQGGACADCAKDEEDSL